MTAVSGATHVYWPRAVGLSATAVVLGFLCQTAILPAVGLSAAIPVLFSVVAVLGIALGRNSGAITGFAAGLLLDVTGVGVLGVGALVGCLLGVASAGIRVDRWRWSGAVYVWAYTAGAAAAYAAVNSLITGSGLMWSSGFWAIVGGSLVCTLVLLPLRAPIRAVVR
ncbi:MAG: hypothetical protein R2720_12665 [Candidatus Nanopelagicales bacterium]